LAIKNNMISIINKLAFIKLYNITDTKCIICLDNINNRTILINCGHSCYCKNCSITINKCAICSCSIEYRFVLPT
jgi:hypothetical protein